MDKKVFLLLSFSFIVLFSIKSFSQQIDNKLNSVDSLIQFLAENEDNREIYFEIDTDGEIIKRKKILSLFKIIKSKAWFAETYILKDTVLCKLTIGTREYINKKGSESTNTIENFIFDNEKLCYYNEMKYYEQHDKKDSLIYEVEYYVDNKSIIDYNSKGNFQSDSSEYLDKIILKVIRKTENKDFLLRR